MPACSFPPGTYFGNVSINQWVRLQSGDKLNFILKINNLKPIKTSSENLLARFLEEIQLQRVGFPPVIHINCEKLPKELI